MHEKSQDGRRKEFIFSTERSGSLFNGRGWLGASLIVANYNVFIVFKNCVCGICMWRRKHYMTARQVLKSAATPLHFLHNIYIIYTTPTFLTQHLHYLHNTYIIYTTPTFLARHGVRIKIGPSTLSLNHHYTELRLYFVLLSKIIIFIT